LITIDPSPIDLPGELNQLMLQIDDLVQPRPEPAVANHDSAGASKEVRDAAEAA
jgi:hypothetical protein